MPVLEQLDPIEPPGPDVDALRDRCRRFDDLGNDPGDGHDPMGGPAITHDGCLLRELRSRAHPRHGPSPAVFPNRPMRSQRS